MMQALCNQKHRLRDLFLDGWGIYCHCFVPLAVILLLCNGLDQALKVLLIKAFDAPFKLAEFLGSFASLAGMLSVLVITIESVSGHHVKWTECFRKIRRFFLKAAWVKMIVSIIQSLVGLPAILLVLNKDALDVPVKLFTILEIALMLPFLWISVSLLFSVYAVILREKSGIDALFHSWRLVRHRWWYVFMTVFLLNLPIFIFTMAEQLPWWHVGELGYMGVFNVAELVKTILGGYSTVLITLFFLNLDSVAPQKLIDEPKA
ncbi:hypothetical protein [Tichowtungia aerotolerans]|uniref:DUF7847 domain-containing protein n=1 Tax=Tichowtungia aerotolerans TaxID=2697043 RepID=A0A6P1MHH7_9BACT|nr:hypothetical protein [Tichowtungia aerotolerans]QHI70525.1 hypothetical protein GT409_14115 [Tichowtungia aerotolerans]